MNNNIILLADIGGTNSQFEIYNKKEKKNIFKIKYKTKEFSSSLELLEKVIQDSNIKINRAVLAIAGPVKNNTCKMTNTNLNFDSEEIKSKLKILNVEILNDFTAFGYATHKLNNDEYIILQENEKATGTEIVIGSGTGFGLTTLVKNENKYIVINSEAGHTDFPINNEDEQLLYEFIKLKHNKESIFWEDFLSGRGIEDIYHFLSGEKKLAKEISKIKEEDEFAKETFKIFFKIYARAAKNFALDHLATGGVYLAGGIITKNLDFDKQQFLHEFNSHEEYSEILKQIPVKIIKKYDSSLFGLIEYVNQN